MVSAASGTNLSEPCVESPAEVLSDNPVTGNTPSVAKA